MLGQTYRELLQLRGGRGLSEAEATILLKQILTQLSPIHGAGQAHGNISPDTLFNHEGEAILSPSTGQVYVRASDDIHQVGLTVITLLTNRLPQLLQRPNGTWAWQDECLVSDQFASIVDRMLLPEGQRFEHAMAVQSAMQPQTIPQAPTVVAGYGGPALGRTVETPAYQQVGAYQPESIDPRPLPSSSRPPWFWGAIGAGVMVAVGLGIFLASQSNNKSTNGIPVAKTLVSPSSTAPSISPATPTAATPTTIATPNMFERVSFPQSSCGDPLPSDSSAYPVNFYPVFVEFNDRNLQIAKAQFCQDSLPVTRTDTGRKAVQVSSFTDSGKAAQFKDYIARSLPSSELGPPTVVASSRGGGSDSGKAPKTVVATKQVQFNSGSTGTTLSAALSANQSRHYLLNCGSGQRLTVQTDRGAVEITVRSPNGRTLGSGSSSWSGTLPSSGDYVIEVSASSSTSYSVSVNVL
jgi:hypothetical protein